MAGLFSMLGWVGINNVYAAENQRINKEYCHVSFVAPALVDYVEIPDDIYLGDNVCYLPFIFTGPLKQKRVDMPGTLQEWRASTDFVVTIRRVPLTEALNQIEAPDGGAQSGLFTLVSKTRTELSGGDLYTLHFKATKPTENMKLLKTYALTIYVLGNSKYSATFYAYLSEKNPRRMMRQRTYRELFSSFSFLPEIQDKNHPQ